MNNLAGFVKRLRDIMRNGMMLASMETHSV